jgi:hypothetical protein
MDPPAPRLHSKLGVRWFALGAVLGLLACGGPDAHHPGKLTLSVLPSAASTPDLVLTRATMRLEHVQVFGNVPPPRPPPPIDLSFDALASGGVSQMFAHLPPGVYSRVQLSVDDVMIEGTWRGTPFTARFMMFGGAPVDLRSLSGHELTPDDDLDLIVTVDVSSWFAGNLLDSAMATGGQITCDGLNNQPVTMELIDRIRRSFALP